MKQKVIFSVVLSILTGAVFSPNEVRAATTLALSTSDQFQPSDPRYFNQDNKRVV